MKDYTKAIFGDISKVRELFVQEMRSKRIRHGMSRRKLTALLNIKPGRATAAMVEDNPRLFTHAFLQRFGWESLDRDELFLLEGPGINRAISAYLRRRGKLREAIASLSRNKDNREFIRTLRKARLSNTQAAEILIFESVMGKLQQTDIDPPQKR